MKKWFGPALNLGLWTIYGAFMTVQIVYDASLGTHPVSWMQGFVTQMSYAYVWAAFTPFIMRFASRFPIVSRRWARNSILHFIAGLAFALVTVSVWDVGVMPLLQPATSPRTFARIARELTWALDFGLLNYCLVVACHISMHYYDRYHQGELRAAQLRVRLARAQLDALKMQLEPHFLFNTLHTIAELLHDSPDVAEQMLVRLSEFLRLTLAQEADSEVTLHDELNFLEQYIAIQKLRFEERLRVELEIAPETFGALVPNLILQPLVENAFKHGVSRCSKGATLRICSNRREGKLALSVRNTCPAVTFIESSNVRKGVGLTNTEERLRCLYGPDSVIRIQSASGGEFQVTLEIPYRSAADRTPELAPSALA